MSGIMEVELDVLLPITEVVVVVVVVGRMLDVELIALLLAVVVPGTTLTPTLAVPPVT
jgi:hypothetical protein